MSTSGEVEAAVERLPSRSGLHTRGHDLEVLES